MLAVDEKHKGPGEGWKAWMNRMHYLDIEDAYDVHCDAEKTKLNEEDQQPY